MAGAVNGRVRGGVADPVPEMQLRPMELPDGERQAALEYLNLALAKRDPRKPALDPETMQAVYTAFLRGWTDCRWHAAKVNLAEVRGEMDGESETLATVRIAVERGSASASVAQGQLFAEVDSRVPDEPSAIGRRRA